MNLIKKVALIGFEPILITYEIIIVPLDHNAKIYYFLFQF